MCGTEILRKGKFFRYKEPSGKVGASASGALPADDKPKLYAAVIFGESSRPVRSKRSIQAYAADV
jgi:hypothetical protein